VPPTTTFSQSFLDTLHREDLRVGVGQSDQEAIKLGRAVCQQLDNGQSEQQQEQLAVQLAAWAGLSTQDAFEFVVISVENYCPEHEKLISSPQTTVPQVPSATTAR
jgi:Protein of unknown function (DUF732)